MECDDGIGVTEFWGRVSNDSRPYVGSHCCGAEIDLSTLAPGPAIREWLDDP